MRGMQSMRSMKGRAWCAWYLNPGMLGMQSMRSMKGGGALLCVYINTGIRAMRSMSVKALLCVIQPGMRGMRSMKG